MVEHVVDLVEVQTDRLGYLEPSEKQRRLDGMVAAALPRLGRAPGPVRTRWIERGQGGDEGLDLLGRERLGTGVLREVSVVGGQLRGRRRRVRCDLQVAVAALQQTQVSPGDAAVLFATSAQLADEAQQFLFADLGEGAVLACEPVDEFTEHEGVDRGRFRGDRLGVGFAEPPTGTGEFGRLDKFREGG